MKISDRFLIAVLAATALLGGTSCEDDLDVTPQGSPTEASFWKTEADAISAINGVYGDLSSEFAGSEGMYGRGYFWLGCVSDDMVIGRSRARVESMRNFTVNGDEYEMYNMWSIPFRLIKRANDVLRNVPEMDIDPAVKQRVIAEASFISGLMYLQLAPMYGDARGGIPIMDPMEPLDYNRPRPASVQENYDYIVSLFQTAADGLPYFSELNATDYGRAHKTAAWAYMAKAYLYAGKYAEAEAAAALVINSGQHALLTSFSDVFKVDNNYSTEYIWSALGSVNPIAGSMLPGVMLENKGWGQYNGWGYMKPTRELYDAFEAGDSRRDATILKPGDVFTYFGDENFVYVPGGDSYHTGMQFNKYMDPYRDANLVSTNGDYPTTALNVPLLRYAEVVLIAAEAKLMQGKDADTEINSIRNRAGLNSKTGATMEDLKHERHCELAGEINYRHFDLVRWGDAQAVYSNPAHRFDGTEIWPGRSFDPAVHHVWPIPPRDIEASQGVLTQNQGW